jgi:hypothetical protein
MATAYPTWKVVAWRYLRVFIAAFLGSLTFDQLLVGGGNVWVSVLKSAFIAGISALFKYLREEFEDNKVVEKLPL